MNTKKEFQKVVAAIRADAKKENPKAEYPKAMMTGQQQELGTATINCGRGAESSRSMAQAIMKDERFKKFMHDAVVDDAYVEQVVEGRITRYQVRVNFA